MKNTDIQATYNQLWSRAVPSIQTHALKVDSHLLNKSSDARRGLTIICRPSQDVQHSVQTFLEGVKEMEPSQYFYTSAELHTTVLSIITCNTESNVKDIKKNPYFEILWESIQSMPPFHINYNGITASPDSVLIQGFSEDAHLQALRQNIRNNIKKSNVHNTLDQRYKTHTAHMTCLRFQTPALRNSKTFLAYLNNYRTHHFGTSRMTNLEFVVHDWYMSEGKTEILQEYPLKHL